MKGEVRNKWNGNGRHIYYESKVDERNKWPSNNRPVYYEPENEVWNTRTNNRNRM
jgi:hypothetical protein